MRKNTVEDLADEKWEEYTGEDMTILNADIHAEKVSFTSGENPEPQSLRSSCGRRAQRKQRKTVYRP